MNQITEYLKNVNERLLLDRLRVVAILLVIIGHATRMFTTNGVYAGTLPSVPFFEQVTAIIYSFHMPLFIMISGYVYAICVNKGGDYNTLLPFLKKKSLRLLVPYYFWGIVYVAPVMVFLSITQYSYIDYVKTGIFLGFDSRHLWFLFTLFSIFAIVQVIRLSVSRIKYLQDRKAIVVTVGLAVSYLLTYISNTSLFCINSITEYLVFFLIGYALKNFQYVSRGGVFACNMHGIAGGFVRSIRVFIPCYSYNDIERYSSRKDSRIQ